jgi:serine/threonine protein kinase
MKNCKSIYLPKYYFPTNIFDQNSILSNSLLMEHIPFKTLSEVLQNNSGLYSLQSKLALMFSICQSLRYLREFNIVHLDLKPNNIITYYNFYIKLIDFG